MLAAASRAADTREAALVVGPSGSGVSLLARSIHEASAQADGPFEVIDGASLDADHAFDAVFGNLVSRRRGALSRAEGGTVCFDRFEELPREVQAGLVSLLDTHTYLPRGADASRELRTRLVFTTSADLETEADAGRIRRSLRQRLLGVRIRVPALSDRRADIPVLLDALGRRVAAPMGLPWPGLAPASHQALVTHPWAGEVRGLEAAVRRALVRTGGTAPLTCRDLCDEEARHAQEPMWFDPGAPLLTWRDARNRFAAAYLEHALDVHDGNVTAMARALGLSRSRAFALLGELDVRRPD